MIIAMRATKKKVGVIVILDVEKGDISGLRCVKFVLYV